MRQISVESYFGPKLVSKEEFVSRWLDHVNELHNLGDYETVLKVMNQVETMAEKKFESIYLRQTKEVS